eukprot:TRINITY_DN971_c0_g1_i3.p1 TRINITY_DN971_c0_g1~~TRINITY_DN971_c0_g1_i3.p1  ORF type:complete len:279 (+),score=43.54 TRINITY_DN971_c0_g1_i3:71-907(+)
MGEKERVGTGAYTSYGTEANYCKNRFSIETLLGTNDDIEGNIHKQSSYTSKGVSLPPLRLSQKDMEPNDSKHIHKGEVPSISSISTSSTTRGVKRVAVTVDNKKNSHTSQKKQFKENSNCKLITDSTHSTNPSFPLTRPNSQHTLYQPPSLPVSFHSAASNVNPNLVENNLREHKLEEKEAGISLFQKIILLTSWFKSLDSLRQETKEKLFDLFYQMQLEECSNKISSVCFYTNLSCQVNSWFVDIQSNSKIIEQFWLALETLKKSEKEIEDLFFSPL